MEEAHHGRKKVLLPIDFQIADSPGRGRGRGRGKGALVERSTGLTDRVGEMASFVVGGADKIVADCLSRTRELLLLLKNFASL